MHQVCFQFNFFYVISVRSRYLWMYVGHFFTDSKWETDRPNFLISKGNYKQMVSNASYLVS